MTPLVKCLLHRQEDLSVDHQHAYKIRGWQPEPAIPEVGTGSEW